MRLLAAELGLGEDELAATVARGADEAIVADLSARHPAAADAFHRCRATARRALIAERGDPAPHRMA